MTIRTWTNGLSRLDLERDPDGALRFAVHGLDRRGDVVEYGYVAVFRGSDLDEIAEFIGPRPQLFATRPEDYRRDQYDPRDFAEEEQSVD
ncbi:hypothetical protein [Nocardia brasiliensis]|uniref:hypothetical protein n=1 Tax=Nocardia brasiliensis TaxID=37326 RepID=UPI0024550B0A|nr:hypothetical protein [Nocardia brasiliensis]